jgi:hypothetical protein
VNASRALTFTGMRSETLFETFGGRVSKAEKRDAKRDAKRVKLTPSQWLRAAVVRMLADPMTIEEAAEFRQRASRADINGKVAAESKRS